MAMLGIIPARGGSKGIPKKNLIDLCGKPLIQWSIETGIELVKNKTLKKCIVSTDNVEIAKVSKSFGIEVPFLRPKKYSADKSKSIEFVKHALDFFEKKDIYFTEVMILQPTTPKRDSKLIKKISKDFIKSSSQTLISCYKEDYINSLVMYEMKTKSSLIAVSNMHNQGIRRQEQKKLFIRNGSIYITRVNYIKKENKLICENPYLFQMNKINSFNIDTLEDLIILRKLLC